MSKLLLIAYCIINLLHVTCIPAVEKFYEQICKYLRTYFLGKLHKNKLKNMNDLDVRKKSNGYSAY